MQQKQAKIVYIQIQKKLFNYFNPLSRVICSHEGYDLYDYEHSKG